MADRRKQGLAKRIRAAEVAASIAAPDLAPGGDGIQTTKTKTDRFPAGRRLAKLEAVRSITGNSRKGLEARLVAIEAAE